MSLSLTCREGQQGDSQRRRFTLEILSLQPHQVCGVLVHHARRKQVLHLIPERSGHPILKDMINHCKPLEWDGLMRAGTTKEAGQSEVLAFSLRCRATSPFTFFSNTCPKLIPRSAYACACRGRGRGRLQYLQISTPKQGTLNPAPLPGLDLGC